MAKICPKDQENMPSASIRDLYSFNILVTLFEQVVIHGHITLMEKQKNEYVYKCEIGIHSEGS